MHFWWFSPELCVGEGVLSVSSDIYAYAMTMLEVSDVVFNESSLANAYLLVNNQFATIFIH